MQKTLKILTLAAALLPLGAKAQSDCSPMALPYSCGFETSEIMSTSAATALPYCSQRYTSPGTSGLNNPYSFSQSASYAHSGSRYLMFNGNTGADRPDTVALILPEVDVTNYPMNSNRITFWARAQSANVNKKLYIATLSDPDDMGTLTVIDSISVTGNTYTQHFIPLSAAEATDAYVVLLFRKTSVSGSIMVDDLTLEAAPMCNEITGLHIVDSLTTTSSLTLSWNPSGATSYKVYNAADTTLVASGVTDTFLTVNSLNANTYYSFAVRGVCGSDSSALSASVGTRTLCTPFAAPYTWTFDDMDVYAAPLCFEEAGNGAAVVVNDGESQHSGSNFVRFSGGTTSILVLPELSSAIDSLQLKFWTVPSENTERCGTFAVGYMTDAADASTFVALETFSYSDFNGYEQRAVMYNNAPAGSRMAMRHTPNDANWGWWYVDDVTIDTLPNCIPVGLLTVSDLTSSEATLSWQGTATSYTVYRIDGQDTILFQTTSTPEVYLLSLLPNTSYTFGVIATCGTDVSDIRTISFTTPCASVDLPYTETFEATSPQLGCWSQLGDVNWLFAAGDYFETTGAYEGAVNATAYTGNNIPATARLISPLINTDNATTLKVTFAHIQRTWGSGIDELRVLYRSSPEGEWATGAVYTNAIETWTVDSVTLQGNTVQVAFEFANHYGYGVAIDSVVFSTAEESICFPVTGLHIVESLTSTDSLVLSWNGNGETVSIIDMSDSTVLASEVTDTFFVVSNLAPATYYTFGVVVNCIDEQSEVRTVTGRTLCGIYAAPYTWNFEGNNPSVAPDCWEVLSGSIYVENSSSAHDGSQHLRFGSSTNGIIVLPEFTTDANTLQMSLWLRPSNNTAGSGNFHVGYLTNPNDASTFTAVASYPYNEFTASGIAGYGQRSVSFANVPAGARIALRAAPTATYYSWYVDEVAITAIPDCQPVSGLVARQITSESVTLAWESDASGFFVYDMADSSQVGSANDTVYTINNLMPNTSYTFGVATDCGTEVADTVTITVHTSCDAIAIPYTEGFEDSGSYPCWHLVNASPMTGPTDYSAFSGDNSFRFVYSTNPPQYLISPELSGTGNGIQVSFMYSTYGSFSESFAVGYSTTSNDPSAFVWSTEQTDLTNTDYLPYSEIYTAADIKYIAIKYTANNQYYLYIDSLVVREIPSCLPVTGLAADSVGTSTASLSWSGEAASYTIMNGSTQVATGITDTHYTVSGLTSGTEYTFTVIANCSATDASDPVSISVTTEPELHVTFAVNDATMGTTTPAPGNYTYTLADTVHFSATANSGYRFVEWILDGGTGLDTLDAEYQSAYVPASTWMAFGNVTLTAVFEAEPTTGIDDMEDGNIAISTAGLRIVVEGAEHQDIRIYSVDGRCVRMQTDVPTAAEFTMDAAGVYLVKVGDRPARRIVIVR